MKEIAEIQIGYQAKKAIEPKADSDWQIIQLRDFGDDRQLKKKPLTRFKVERNPERYRVNSGDVLFLYRGYKNFGYAINRDLENVVAAGYFYILKILDESVLPEYLAWYLNQDSTRKYFQRNARQGTNMPVIGKSAFENFSVRIPHLSVQNLIVNLDKELRRERSLTKSIQKERMKLFSAMSMRVLSNSTIAREANSEGSKWRVKKT